MYTDGTARALLPRMTLPTLTENPETLAALTTLCEGHDVSDLRRISLGMAIELGADPAILTVLRDAMRVVRYDFMVLPAHRFENLSRGKGWARRGKGDSAVWGERTGKGYRVGAGRWTVGGNDGFSRKGEDVWVVKHVVVGAETWTIAD